MTTAAAMAAKREFRAGARDTLANSDVSPRGTVSPDSLTTISRGAAAAARQADSPTLPSDLQNTLRAATPPPLAPGQARPGTAGGKPGQSSQIDRGNGIDGRR